MGGTAEQGPRRVTFSQQKPRSNYNTAEAMKKISKGAEALYSAYHEQCKVAEAKERLRKLGSRTAWARKNESQELKWPVVGGPPKY